jgi:hypothetical protein
MRSRLAGNTVELDVDFASGEIRARYGGAEGPVVHCSLFHFGFHFHVFKESLMRHNKFLTIGR